MTLRNIGAVAMGIEDYVPAIDDIDVIYNLDESLDEFGYPRSLPKADALVHYKNCVWAIVEIKGVDKVDKALSQAEASLRFFFGRGIRVSVVFIVLDKMSKNESFVFRRGPNFELLRKTGKKLVHVKIDNVPVYLVYKNEAKKRELLVGRVRIYGSFS